MKFAASSFFLFSTDIKTYAYFYIESEVFVDFFLHSDKLLNYKIMELIISNYFKNHSTSTLFFMYCSINYRSIPWKRWTVIVPKHFKEHFKNLESC